VKRKAGKSRTVYTLELSPKEWSIVASLLEMTVDGVGLTFGDFAECNGWKTASRIRERMAVDDRARARKGKL
jgi:hypothetical protein